MTGGSLKAAVPDEIRNTDNAMVRQFIEGKADGPMKIR